MPSINLNYLDVGSGSPILWIHGYPLSSKIYGPQLSIPRTRHIVPDLPGFGESPEPGGPLRIEDYAGEMRRLLDSLGIRRAAIAGLSMGGYVALALAQDSLSRVAAMILIDTREVADPPEGRRKRFEAIAAVDREGISPVLREMLPKLLSKHAPAELRQSVERIILQSSPRGVTAALQAMADRQDFSEMLPNLRVPALVVVGSEDTITPPADSERMAGALPDARLRVIPGAGHLSNLEKPREFNQVVTEFLSEIGY